MFEMRPAWDFFFSRPRSALVSRDGGHGGVLVGKKPDRHMDLLEYQGKQLFAKHGVAVPEGRRAVTSREAREAAEELGFPVVVKAQVQIGGRGKAGGIKLANDADEAEAHANAILGMDIRGLTVHELW